MTSVNIYLEPTSDRRLVYYPGQVLKGIVELNLESVKKFRGFHVTVHGQARAHWSETRTRTTGTGDNKRAETYTVYFEGKEVYLNSRTYLFGQHGGPTMEIQPGIHRYNFECLLPPQLPYSLDLANGNIEYYVEAVLDIPWRFDKEIKTPFTVSRYDDLNLYPELRNPLHMEEIKTFCCLFCQSGPLVMTVKVPSSGFAVGQSIPIQVDYTNKSNVDIMSTTIKLRRIFSYTSHTPERKTRTDNDKVVETFAAGCKGGDTNLLETILDIPAVLMTSNGRFCQVVTVSYVLEVIGEVSGCHSNPEISFPVVLGSAPIRYDGQPQYPGPSVVLAPEPIRYDVQPQYPGPSVMPSAPFANEMLDLPPTFDEAMKMPNPSYMQQSTPSTLGWNVLEPSAPAPEKLNL